MMTTYRFGFGPNGVKVIEDARFWREKARHLELNIDLVARPERDDAKFIRQMAVFPRFREPSPKQVNYINFLFARLLKLRKRTPDPPLGALAAIYREVVREREAREAEEPGWQEMVEYLTEQRNRLGPNEQSLIDQAPTWQCGGPTSNMYRYLRAIYYGLKEGE